VEYTIGLRLDSLGPEPEADFDPGVTEDLERGVAVDALQGYARITDVAGLSVFK
jgi:hypothetical protein